MKVDKKALREGSRKLGLTLMGIGLAGLLIGADKVAPMEAILLVVLGSVLWFVGLIAPSKKKAGDVKEE